MLMHFISSPTRKKTKTKTTEIRERERAFSFVRQRESTEKCFFVVSPFFQMPPQGLGKGGFHPPWPYPFQETQLFFDATGVWIRLFGAHFSFSLFFGANSKASFTQIICFFWFGLFTKDIKHQHKFLFPNAVLEKTL